MKTRTIPLLLALERRPQAAAAQTAVLAADAASHLLQLIANDLAALCPGIERLQLAAAALLYDPAQLLRPHWPLHRALKDLVERAPRGGLPDQNAGQLLAFGGDGSGQAPPSLAPDPDLQPAALHTVPLLLRGPEADMTLMTETLEAQLFDRGMASAATALYAQDAFGIELEHARYMTRHDLCVLTAVQYEHAGLGHLWPLIESALFEPDSDLQLDADDLPPLRRFGEVLWLGEPAPVDLEARLARVFALPEQRRAALRHWPARLAQVDALLRAHGLAPQRIALDAGQTLAALSLA